MVSWPDSLHNSYAGQRLFILATGPSLVEVEPYLDLLSKEYTIGVNTLHRWEPAQRLKTTFYACSESDAFHMVDHFAFRWSKGPNFFCNVAPVPDGGQAEWLGLYCSSQHPMWEGYFQGLGPSLSTSHHSIPWVAEGRNVVLDVCLQVGCWLGFKEFYLAGVDFTMQGQVYVPGDPMPRNQENMELGRRSFAVAYQAISLSGRKLVAVTPTTLDIPYVPIKEVLGA